MRDTSRIFIRCAEAGLTGAKVYTPRGDVIVSRIFWRPWSGFCPRLDTLVKAEGNPVPVSSDFDDSALQHDLGSVPRTPLEEGIRETAAIFERLNREGRLDTQDLNT